MRTRVKLSILILRVALGLLIGYAGLQKLSEGFSAAGYLEFATAGPFADFFASLTQYISLIDFLVVWGQIGIGVGLVLGIFTRLSSLMMALMMSLFYLSLLPKEYGPINEHIVYILVCGLLIVSNAGRYLGVDGLLAKQPFFKTNKGIFKFLM